MRLFCQHVCRCFPSAARFQRSFNPCTFTSFSISSTLGGFSCGRLTLPSFSSLWLALWGGGPKQCLETVICSGSFSSNRLQANTCPFSLRKAANETRALIRNKRNIDFRLRFGASLVSCLCSLTLELLLPQSFTSEAASCLLTSLSLLFFSNHVHLFTLLRCFLTARCAEQEIMLSKHGASLKFNLVSFPFAGIQAEGGPAGREAAPCLQHTHGDPLGYSQPEEVSDPESEKLFFFFFLTGLWPRLIGNDMWRSVKNRWQPRQEGKIQRDIVHSPLLKALWLNGLWVKETRDVNCISFCIWSIELEIHSCSFEITFLLFYPLQQNSNGKKQEMLPTNTYLSINVCLCVF